MKKNDPRYSAYVEILKQELLPAMGCTEPIAVAYCGALARRALGCIPEQVKIQVSGNIIKNVKSVIVPNTGGMKGIPAAAASGIVAGDPDLALEVISRVTEEDKLQMVHFLDHTAISVEPLENGDLLDIIITLFAGEDYAKVRIAHSHTNIVFIEKNHEVLFRGNCPESAENCAETRDSLLNMESIFDFAETADLADVYPIIHRQIQYNSAISQEGLRNNWGANIGSVVLDTYGNDIRQRAKAAAAAGSDARMSGCELPVVVNSGSGNQGMTVSLPVIEYAKELGSSEEQLYRALILSNLVAIHQKKGIGCLSAYCGAVSAGAAAGCGIAYLQGGNLKVINHTLVNALAITSGVVCDGAKASCAGKIAIAVDAGIMGYEMYLRGQQFRGGDGIVSKGVENTIRNVGRLGAEGMRETDREIIRIMTGC